MVLEEKDVVRSEEIADFEASEFDSVKSNKSNISNISNISDSEDDASEISKISDVPSGEDSAIDEPPQDSNEILLQDRRKEINELMKLHEEAAKEGDKVYIIPQFWYDTFVNPDITDASQLQAINTGIICNDFDNFILNDYEICPYCSIPESVFGKFMKWYGLDEQSKPVESVLIYDKESEKLITEISRCTFQLHHLAVSSPSSSTSSYANQSRSYPITFTLSQLATGKDLITKLLENFYERESHINIEESKEKIWYVLDNELMANDSIALRTYNIDPIQFASLPSITKLAIKSTDKTLRELQLYKGNFIIELMVQNENYHWPSNYFHNNPLKLTSNSTMGLFNLGNSCYMNSALQCLIHIPQIIDYFCYDGFELEINDSNPLGYQGQVARACGSLIQSMFKDSIQKAPAFSPNQFKMKIGHFNSLFSGCAQQDSQEFLAFLLDGLHEDLNRVIDKPQVEKPSSKLGDDVFDFNTVNKLANDTWAAHLLRNDSIITDLFVGLYKSTLQCPECEMLSITFDPYSDLTLPLPVENIWTTKVKIFPQNSPPCMLEVELEKTSTWEDLKKYVARCLDLDYESLFGAEIFSHQFYNFFDAANSSSNYLPISGLISESDDIILYEITKNADDDIIIPVLNTKKEENFKNPRLFGVPFFVTLSKADLQIPGAIRKTLEKRYCQLSGGFVEFPMLISSELSEDNLKQLQSKHSVFNRDDYEEYIRFSNTSDMETNKYFDIKVLNLKDSQISRSNIQSSSDETVNLPNVWTPLAQINLSKADDMNDKINPIVYDIYNFQNLSNTIQESKTEEEDNVSDMSIDSETKDVSPIAQTENLPDVESNEEKISVKNTDEQSVATQDTISRSIIGYNDLIICEWPSESVTEVFDEDRVFNWEKPAEFANTALETVRNTRQQQVSKDIDLHDCLNLFSKKEVLSLADSWYCPECKEHRQATKQIQLWSTPDILLIHLKRFETQNSLSDKIDAVVQFPITEFDLSQHIVNKFDDACSTYDLIAVDNHFGGLGGGHYTAYVKNFSDGKWYYFDDSRVTETVPERSIAGSAYLLFYIRRVPSEEVGSEKLRNVINESRKQYEIKLNQFNEKQERFYEENCTTADELDESDFSETNDDDVTSAQEQDAKKPVVLPKNANYSVESLQIGDNAVDQNKDFEQRKMRILKKTYNNELSLSMKSSDDSDGTNSGSLMHSGSDNDSVIGSNEVAKSPIDDEL